MVQSIIKQPCCLIIEYKDKSPTECKEMFYISDQSHIFQHKMNPEGVQGFGSVFLTLFNLSS